MRLDVLEFGCVNGSQVIDIALSGVVQKVQLWGNTDNVNFGWFAYDSTDGHPKKCYPILTCAAKIYPMMKP